MVVATGCGCKEVYRFPHTILIPTPLVTVLFAAASLLFVQFFFFFFRRKKNAKSRFFTSCGAYVNLRYIALIPLEISCRT